MQAYPVYQESDLFQGAALYVYQEFGLFQGAVLSVYQEFGLFQGAALSVYQGLGLFPGAALSFYFGPLVSVCSSDLVFVHLDASLMALTVLVAQLKNSMELK